MGYENILESQTSRNLLRRPLLCNKQTNRMLHYLRFGSIIRFAMLAIIGIKLSSFVIVMPLFTTVAL